MSIVERLLPGGPHGRLEIPLRVVQRRPSFGGCGQLRVLERAIVI